MYPLGYVPFLYNGENFFLAGNPTLYGKDNTDENLRMFKNDKKVIFVRENIVTGKEGCYTEGALRMPVHIGISKEWRV